MHEAEKNRTYNKTKLTKQTKTQRRTQDLQGCHTEKPTQATRLSRSQKDKKSN